jgi:hypothetical protein
MFDQFFNIPATFAILLRHTYGQHGRFGILAGHAVGYKPKFLYSHRNLLGRFMSKRLPLRI